MNKHYILSDIGGSKTLLRVVDAENRTLYEKNLRGFGIAVESCEPIPELSEELTQVADKFAPSAAAVNLGGRNQRQIETVFAGLQIPLRVWRESEGKIALKLAEHYGAETTLLAGTGSIAISTDRRGGYVIAGGWGCSVGDGGSGYSIGSALVREALAELDRNAPLSEVAKTVTGLSEPLGRLASTAQYRDLRDSVRDKIGPLERRNLASYARLAAELAEGGDEFSRLLFVKAGKELAELTRGAALKAHNGGEVGRVVVSGGLVNSLSLWRESFESELGASRVDYFADGLMLGLFEAAKALERKELT